MKNGKMVAKNLDTKTVSDTELIELMMGEVKTSKFDKNNLKGDTKLEAIDISFTNEQNIKALQNVSLQIKSGKVLGVADVSGNGQVELANIRCGILKDFDGQGIGKTKDVTGKEVKSKKK